MPLGMLMKSLEAHKAWNQRISQRTAQNATNLIRTSRNAKKAWILFSKSRKKIRQQKAHNLIWKSETIVKKQNAQTLMSKSHNARIEGQRHSPPTTIAPPLLYIYSIKPISITLILSSAAKSMWSHKGRKSMKSNQEISWQFTRAKKHTFHTHTS